MVRHLAALALFVTVGAGCSGSDSSSAATVPPVSLTPLTTVAPAATTVPAPATTVAPATTAPKATTTTAATTTTVKATTTTQAAPTPPCDLDLIVRETETAYEGITPTDLRCADVWATWLGRPDDAATSDGFFAVAKWDGGTWVLANLGTAEICGDAGVPESLWDALDCVE